MFSIVDWITDKLKIIGAVCLVGMTFLTCADVVGRFFNHPIFGSVELVGFMATLTVALALPYTHSVRGHIGVEMVVRLFPKRTQAVIELCTNTVSAVLFSLVTWRMVLYARTMEASGEVSMNLEFPEYVIIALVAFCFLIFVLTIVRDVLSSIRMLRGSR
jgi:TRAP-type C4-dicarboxylate transport system permease small subunit